MMSEHNEPASALFDADQAWKMSEPDKLLAIIKHVRIWRLGNHDGCICSSFALRGVNFDISCGKGQPRAVRVYSQSGDYDNNHDALLRPVASEVRRQAQESDGGGEIAVFFAPQGQGGHREN